MVVIRDNVYVDFCEIEDKRFSVSLGRDGGTVRLLEDRRNFSFSLLLSRVAACWLVGIVEECMDFVSEVRFWRRYVGNGFSLIVDVMVNKRGSCLRLLKVAQGEGKMILTPEGSRRNGWRGFARILSSTLKRWSADLSYNNKVQRCEVNKEVNKKVSFVEAVHGQIKNRGRKFSPSSLLFPTLLGKIGGSQEVFAGGVLERSRVRKERSF